VTRRAQAKAPTPEATLAVVLVCEDCGIDSDKRRRLRDPATGASTDIPPIFLAMNGTPLDGLVAAKGATPPRRACLIVDR
jgi:hypothetical protein